mmetsp:Transcript_7843/g.9025  ORF Transcript_7843/g.9025 Transcript_7843/m.9025 type:complete len:92 (+) Transcript_7843:88-363(+)
MLALTANAGKKARVVGNGNRQTYKLERVDSCIRRNIFMDTARQVGAGDQGKQPRMLFESGSRRRSNYTMIQKETQQLVNSNEGANRSLISG